MKSVRQLLLNATKGKRYSEIPLTREQIKAVYTFFEEMGKTK